VWSGIVDGPPLATGGVTQYATVQDLITAAHGALDAGYYEVVGEWITYWNGATFSPELPETPPDQFSVYSVGLDFTNFDPNDDTASAPNMYDDFNLS